MSTMFNLGGGEIILILALILILFGGGKFPTLAKCFEAIPSFWKARKPKDNLAKPPDRNVPQEPNHHPVLMGITVVLGTVCVALGLYELFK
jgi:hypothetical protein